MKYMKHLRKLALLSSLALSFTAAYGDGTLPLPGIKDVPMELSNQSTTSEIRLNLGSISPASSAANIPGFKDPCSVASPFHVGSGTARFSNSEFDVVGVCVPKEIPGVTDNRRTIVATDGATMLLLKGEAFTLPGTKLLDKFTGTIESQGAGFGPEASATTFTLYPVPKK